MGTVVCNISGSKIAWKRKWGLPSHESQKFGEKNPLLPAMSTFCIMHLEQNAFMRCHANPIKYKIYNIMKTTKIS